MQKWYQITKTIPLWLILASFSIFIIHLTSFPLVKSKVYDELYYATLGRSYLSGAPAFDAQPPFGKEIISLGTFLFGDNSFGWRFFSSLFHSLLAVLIYWVSFLVFKDKKVSLLSVLLFLSETMLFVLGHLALLEILVTLFFFLSFLYFLKFKEDKSLFSLVVFSILVGLSISIKWTIAFPGIFLLISLFFHLKKEKRVKLFLTSLLVILVVYLLTFWPHLIRGEDILFWHQDIVRYHLTTDKSHFYSTYAWLWPLDFKGVWMFFQRDGSIVQTIFLIGNPIIFITQLSAFVWLIKRKIWLESNAAYLLGISGIGFLQWLPFKDTFLYNWAPILPFNLILIAYFLKNQVRGKTLLLLLILTVLMFIFMLPLMVGWKVSENYFLLRFFLWLNSMV